MCVQHFCVAVTKTHRLVWAIGLRFKRVWALWISSFFFLLVESFSSKCLLQFPLLLLHLCEDGFDFALEETILLLHLHGLNFCTLWTFDNVIPVTFKRVNQSQPQREVKWPQTWIALFSSWHSFLIFRSFCSRDRHVLSLLSAILSLSWQPCLILEICWVSSRTWDSSAILLRLLKKRKHMQTYLNLCLMDDWIELRDEQHKFLLILF